MKKIRVLLGLCLFFFLGNSAQPVKYTYLCRMKSNQNGPVDSFSYEKECIGREKIKNISGSVLSRDNKYLVIEFFELYDACKKCKELVTEKRLEKRKIDRLRIKSQLLINVVKLVTQFKQKTLDLINAGFDTVSYVDKESTCSLALRLDSLPSCLEQEHSLFEGESNKATEEFWAEHEKIFGQGEDFTGFDDLQGDMEDKIDKNFRKKKQSKSKFNKLKQPKKTGNKHFKLGALLGDDSELEESIELE